MSDSMSAYEDSLVERQEKDRHTKMGLEEMRRSRVRKAERLKQEAVLMREQADIIEVKATEAWTLVEHIDAVLEVME